MEMGKCSTTLVRALAFGCVLVGAASAKEAAVAANGDAAELAKKLQNPVAALISVPLQSNFEWGGGPNSDGFKYLLNVQPVIPIGLSDKWNLISRTIVPIIHQEDVVPGHTQSGIGDILQSLFFSPVELAPGGIVWGAGPAFLLPTASEDFLGAEKLGFGPTVVALKQDSGFTFGVLANHLVAVGQISNKPNLNATFVQPFLSYTNKMYTTFAINTESTYDWEGSKWTVPLNANVSQLLKLGSQRVQFTLGPKLYAEGPTPAPDWGLRFAVTLLFPK